ncbi:MAG: hypothetical protein AUK47_09160 [Deltaproteobacteria bacterium CG2_30_63_29]|nr:MAG: hypothetical protein AUK47_09160 [Deltaproteobacteria bacterium CG2_30_63_29]
MHPTRHPGTLLILLTSLLLASTGAPVTAMGQKEAFDLQESADTHATTGAVLMGLGGVLAATGVILVLTDSGDEEAVGVSAVGLPGGFVVGMQGRF